MLSRRQQQCLKGIGIRQWLGRSVSGSNTEVTQLPETVPQEQIEVIEQALPEKPVIISAPVKLDSWDNITQSIHQCQACELAGSCTQKVPGVGPVTSRCLCEPIIISILRGNWPLILCDLSSCPVLRRVMEDPGNRRSRTKSARNSGAAPSR